MWRVREREEGWVERGRRGGKVNSNNGVGVSQLWLMHDYITLQNKLKFKNTFFLLLF